MFSASIIKEVFFRDKGQLSRLAKEIKNITHNQNPEDKEAWKAFIDAVNNPNDGFNSNAPKPKVVDFSDRLDDNQQGS